MSICAVLIAQACNVGYKPPVNENVPALRLERLKYIARQGPQRENWCSPKRTAYRCLHYYPDPEYGLSGADFGPPRWARTRLD